MGRLDWKSGRFDADLETKEIASTLRGWQAEFGDRVLYYRYWGDESEIHDIWREATGVGRVWHPADEVEVLHVTHIEGRAEERAQGQYYNSTLHVTASWNQLQRLGMTEMDLLYQSFLNDRIVYDYRVFRVTQIQVMGQIQRRDVVVSIEATQVKPDEMLNDPQFVKFANPTFPSNP